MSKNNLKFIDEEQLVSFRNNLDLHARDLAARIESAGGVAQKFKFTGLPGDVSAECYQLAAHVRALATQLGAPDPVLPVLEKENLLAEFASLAKPSAPTAGTGKKLSATQKVLVSRGYSSLKAMTAALDAKSGLVTVEGAHAGGRVSASEKVAKSKGFQNFAALASAIRAKYPQPVEQPTGATLRAIQGKTAQATSDDDAGGTVADPPDPPQPGPDNSFEGKRARALAELKSAGQQHGKE